MIRDAVVCVAPPHGVWSKSLKWFLLVRYATRQLFPAFRTHQASWEFLLTATYEGERFPDRTIIKQGVSPDKVFDMATADAEKWKADGAKAEFL